MSEDLTQNLPSRSFEERVLAELTAIRGTLSQLDARMNSLGGRTASLEGIVDARLHDTRPMWESAQERLTGVGKELNSLNRHFKSFAAEFPLVRNRAEHLENDVEDLAGGRS